MNVQMCTGIAVIDTDFLSIKNIHAASTNVQNVYRNSLYGPEPDLLRLFRKQKSVFVGLHGEA